MAASPMQLSGGFGGSPEVCRDRPGGISVRPGTAARRKAGAGVAEPHLRRDRHRGWLPTRRPDAFLAHCDRPEDHGHPLVRAALLRHSGTHWNGTRDEPCLNARPEVVGVRSDAPSTPGSPPRKASSRISTPSTPSARPARRTSPARGTKAGSPSQPPTMTAGSLAAPWSARPCSGCSRISRTTGST